MNLNVIWGALLHDIGKFCQRTDRGDFQTKSHSLIGKKWWDEESKRCPSAAVDPKIVSDCIARHHQKDKPEDSEFPEVWIVYESDNLSAMGDRRESSHEEEGFARYGPLGNVFDHVCLDGEKTKPKIKTWFALKELSKKPCFPSNKEFEVTESHYKVLWQSFINAYSKCGENTDSEGLLNLLERFTSHIPSDTRRNHINDISLFDHLKSTTAIASAMDRWFQDKGEKPDFNGVQDRSIPRYLLVKGELSGIQNFLFTSSSKGALKTLRARSFLLELFCEHILLDALSRLNLCRANVIFTGGGGFAILSQNSENSRNIIEELEAFYQRTFFEQHGEKLFFTLSYSELSGNDLTSGKLGNLKGGACLTCGDEIQKKPEKFIPGIARAWQEISLKASEKKRRRFTGYWQDLFTPKNPSQYLQGCEQCRRDDLAPEFYFPMPDQPEKALCPTCKNVIEVGEVLPDSTCLVRRADNDETDSGIFLAVSTGEKFLYSLLSQVPDERKDEHRWVINSFNESQLGEPNTSSLWCSRYEYKVSHGTPTLEELADSSTGIPRLAVLRMDVDNLGRTFSHGLPSYLCSYSRTAIMSRRLAMFFKLHLDSILSSKGMEKEDIVAISPSGTAGRAVVVIYSGGDDVMLAGAWNEVHEAGLEIRKSFSRFVGKNPHITLSAGISVSHPNIPILHLAEVAGKAEKVAKEFRDEKGKYKDAVTIFSDGTNSKLQKTCTLSWNCFEENLLGTIKLFSNAGLWENINRNGINFKQLRLAFPKGRLFRWLQLAGRYSLESGGNRFLILPHFAYELAKIREMKSLFPKEIPEEKLDGIRQLLIRSINEKTTVELLIPALRWIDWASRSRKENDSFEMEGE